MVNVAQIYDMAIHLMDEQNETNGETHTIDTEEYKFRTISILNTVIPQLSIYSDDNRSIHMQERFLHQTSYTDPDFQQAIALDDDLAMALLPLYLAAQLESTENPELAAWFMQRYNEVFYDIRGKQSKAKFEKIPAPCGLF